MLLPQASDEKFCRQHCFSLEYIFNFQLTFGILIAIVQAECRPNLSVCALSGKRMYIFSSEAVH